MGCILAASANHPLSGETMQQLGTRRKFICGLAGRIARLALADCGGKFAVQIAQTASGSLRTECAATELSHLAGRRLHLDGVGRSKQVAARWVRSSALAAIEREAPCRARNRRDFVGGPTPAIGLSHKEFISRLRNSRCALGLHQERLLNPSLEATKNPR